MTLDEVNRRAFNALGSHQARTAIDLTRVESLRIVVNPASYNDVCREARKLMQTGGFGYAHLSVDRELRIGGVLIIPDHDLGNEDVRLRTEVVA